MELIMSTNYFHVPKLKSNPKISPIISREKLRLPNFVPGSSSSINIAGDRKINGNNSSSLKSSTNSLMETVEISSGNGKLSTTSVDGVNTALDQLDIERGVCVPFRKYTPQTVRNKVLESRGAILSLVGRGVEIVWKLGLYWSTLVYDYFIGRDEEVVPFRANQLRNLLCDLGPSFIKAGQDIL